MSYTAVPAQTVTVLVERYLERRKDRIDREREEMIARAMFGTVLHIRKAWPFVSWRQRTRDEAIAWIKVDHRRGWDDPEWTGYRRARQAEKLLALAKLGDPVMVDSDDAEILEAVL